MITTFIWLFVCLALMFLARQLDKMRWRIEELEEWREKVKEQLL